MSDHMYVSISNLCIRFCSYSLPSSSNDVRVHRQLLGTHHAPSRYLLKCTRPEVDTSIAC